MNILQRVIIMTLLLPAFAFAESEPVTVETLKRDITVIIERIDELQGPVVKVVVHKVSGTQNNYSFDYVRASGKIKKYQAPNIDNFAQLFSTVGRFLDADFGQDNGAARDLIEYASDDVYDELLESQLEQIRDLRRQISNLEIRLSR